MRDSSTLSGTLDDKNAHRTEFTKWILPVILLALVLVLVVIAAFSKQPPNVWSATDIVLYFLTSILCTLVAISFALTGFAAPLARTEQSIQPVAADVANLRNEQADLCDTVTKGNQEIGAVVSQLQRNQRLLRDQFTRFAEHLQTMTSGQATLSQALQTYVETIKSTLTDLATGQAQLSLDVRQVTDATHTLAKNVSGIAAEQAGLLNTARTNSQVLTGTIEAIQQNQKALQSQIEEATEAGKQTLVAVTEVASAQKAADEIAHHTVTAVTDIGVQQAVLAKVVQAHTEDTKTALTDLTDGQGRLNDGVRQVADVAQSLAKNVADTVSEQVGARSMAQDDRQALVGGIEAIQQNQKTLQTQIEQVTEAGKQALAAISGIVAEQSIVRETAGRIVAGVSGIEMQQASLSQALQGGTDGLGTALTELTTGQGRLATDVRQVAELTQTLVKSVTDISNDQVGLLSTIRSKSQAVVDGIEAIQQNQKAIQTQIDETTESGQQVLDAVTGMAADQTVARETTERIFARVTDVDARQTALGEALQSHAEASKAATTALAAGQGHLSSDVQYVTDLAQTLVKNVADATGEQVAVCSVLQDSAKVLVANAEAIQTRIETATKSGDQTLVAVAGMAAEQAALRETLRDKSEELNTRMMAVLESQVAMNTSLGDLSQTANHIVGEVTGIKAGQAALGETLHAHTESTKAAAYALTAGQGQLSSDVHELTDMAQTLVKGVVDITSEQGELHNTVRTGSQAMTNAIDAVQQNHRVLQAQIGEVTAAGKQTLEAVASIGAQQVAFGEAARAASDELSRKTTAMLESQLTLHTPVDRLAETAERIISEVTGIGARQDIFRETLQTHAEATDAGMTDLTAAHGQLNSRIQHLEELTQAVASDISSVASEQAAVRTTLHDSGRILAASAEAIQENQQTLQTQMEEAAESGKQIFVGVTGIAAEQAAMHEGMRNRSEELDKRMMAVIESQLTTNTDLHSLNQTASRIVSEVTGMEARQATLGDALQVHAEATAAATTGLAAGQGQLSGDIRQVADMARTLVGNAAAIADEQTRLHNAIQDNSHALAAGIEVVQQNQRTLQTQMEEAAGTGKQTQATVTGIAAEQAVAGQTLQSHAEATRTSLTELVTGQGRLSDDVQRVTDLAQTLVRNASDIAGEQAGLHSTVQGNHQALTAGIEAVQQNQRILQTQVEEAAGTGRQTLAAVTGVAAEQVALHGTVTNKSDELNKGMVAILESQLTIDKGLHELSQTAHHIVGKATNIEAGQKALGEALYSHAETTRTATAELAAGHGQLSGDIRQVADMAQTLIKNAADIAGEQTRLHGTIQANSQALVHGVEVVQENQRNLQTSLDAAAETGKQTLATVSGISAGQAVMSQALQAHAETANAATASLTAGHGQLSGDIRQVADMAQTVIKNAADIAGEQTRLHSTVQSTSQALASGIEVVQQNQRTLQTDLEAATETGKQTLATVTGISAEQAALSQALQDHAQATNAGTASLTAEHGQLSSDVRQVADMAHTLIKNVADIATEQAGLHNTVQADDQTLAAGVEAIQENQRTLQAQVEEVAGTARHTLTTATGIEAQQTTVGQTLRTHVEAAKTAAASLTSGQGQLSNDIRHVTDLAQTLIRNLTDVADGQAGLHSTVQTDHQALAGGIETIQQNQRTLETQIEGSAETGKQTLRTVNAIAVEQVVARETAQRIAAGVTNIETQQAAVGRTLQTHAETTSTATTSLAAGQGQLSSDVRQITGLTQTLIENVGDMAGKQAEFSNAVEADNRALANGIESVQQNQKELQTQIGEATDVGKQTLTTVTGIAAEQTVTRETAQRLVAGVTGLETRQTALGEALQAHTEATNTTMAGLSAGQGQLNADVRQMADLAQTLIKSAADIANGQAGLHSTVEADNQALAGGIEAIEQNQKVLQTKVDTMTALAERHQTHLDTLNTIAQQAAATLGTVGDKQADMERAYDDLIARLAALTEDRQQWMEQFSATQADILKTVESMCRLEQDVIDLPESLQPYIQGVTDLLTATSQHCVQLGDKFDQNIRELIESVSHIHRGRHPSGHRCAKARK